MRSKHIIIFGFFMTLIACSTTTQYYEPRARNGVQSNLMKPPMEPGKCYAKCIAANLVQTDQKYPIYTGDNVDDPSVEEITIEIAAASTRWVKKRADKNCLSRNPDDCLVWCLVEDPKVSKTVLLVIDTINNKDFELDYIKSDMPSTESYTWKEVVCENDITNKLLSDLTLRLNESGYDLNQGTDQKMLFASLKQYQKSNGLASGGLTIETLRFMGLRH